MSNESFIFGTELVGRGTSTQLDRYAGLCIFSLACIDMVLGGYNLYIVRKLDIFQNPFGRFWFSRTLGELGMNLVNGLYAGFVTYFQPISISPLSSIVFTNLSYFFGCHACVMHQVISVNRLLAVWTPFRYQFLFTNRVCKILIFICWIVGVFLVLPLEAFPCNLLGYSPKLYSFIFVKCRPMERDYSIVGTIVNRICAFVICLVTMFTDFFTFVKIVHITRFGKINQQQNSKFKRDVRFFCQTAVQNVTMMITSAIIVIENNSLDPNNPILKIVAFNILCTTHICNSAALILFNPEVRGRFIKRSLTVTPYSSTILHSEQPERK